MKDVPTPPEGVPVSLNGNSRAILDASAQAILAGRNADTLNLFSLNAAFQSRDGMEDIVATLARRVEYHSGNRRTIRRADAALFQQRVRGVNLYLVLCSRGTPEGMVTELGDAEVLISFGPYSNGFDIGANRATRAQVENHRAFVARSERARQLRQRAEGVIEAFLGTLTEALRRRVQQYGDAELRTELQRELQHKTVLTLEKVAYFTAAMDITIESLTQTS